MTKRYEIGELRLDPEARVLTHAGEPVALGARGVAVLTALVSRATEYVAKAEIMDAAWPGLVVEEANLAVQISAIRRALAVVPGGEGWIETLARRGYRFVGPVVKVAERRADMPALADRARTNLPQVATSFVGREREIAEIKRLLPITRLLTLIGTGGIGKTRLALQAAAEVFDAYRDGIWFVDLARLSDPALVVEAIAGTLGLEIGSADPLASLLVAVKPRNLLLALDNAEHLLDDVIRITETLIANAPQLQVLVTSQAPLRIVDEYIYRLGALAVPEASVPMEQAIGFDAVALFVVRAQARDNRFALTPANVATVIDICRQLDGVALAIELAAARVPLLGVAKLASTLDERFRLLTQGSRDAPLRQQTLLAALEWSYALLNPTEQAILRRLGLFAGSFGLELAQEVVTDPSAGPSMDEWTVIDALGTLVDNSWIAVDTAEPPRYRLLESARAFALDRLAACGEDSAGRCRHAHAVRTRFQQVRANHLAGTTGFDEAVAMLVPDLDNARDAVVWALVHDEPTAIALAEPLSFCLNNEHHLEVRRLWEATSECVQDNLPLPLQANWALGCSNFWRGHKPVMARTWALVAIKTYRELENAVGLYRGLFALARFDMARASAEQRGALVEMRALEERTWPAAVRICRADAELFVHEVDGAFEAALAARQSALLLAQESGNSAALHEAQISLPDLELSMGRVDEAVLHGEELVAHLLGTRHQECLGYALLNLFEAWLAKGAAATAREVAEKGWPLALRFNRQLVWTDNLALLAALEHRPRCAAYLLGFGDAAYTANAVSRQFNEARAAELAERLAREELGDNEFDRLKTTGLKLCDNDIATLAFKLSDQQ